MICLPASDNFGDNIEAQQVQFLTERVCVRPSLAAAIAFLAWGEPA